MIAGLARDVQLAARALRRSPGFTLTAGLTLALGIGATASASALLGSVLFAPLPYAQPDRLVSVWDSGPWGGTNQVSPPNFADWVDQARSFEAIGAFQREEFSVTGEGEPDRLPGQRVTAGVFDVLGVEAALGRRVQHADVPGGNVVVLSDGLWQRRFGRDPGVVGRTLRVDGEPHEVVGVMPPGFRLPGAESAEWADAALWAPIEQDPRSLNRGAHGMIVLARLRPEVAVADARQEMTGIAARLAAAHPDTNRGWSAKVLPLHERVVGHVRRPLTVLSGGLLFLLLIACANVSHMLLARGVHRGGEMAVRAALGASRARLVRQLLTEAAVVWMVGAAAGLLIARWALEAVKALAPASLPRLGELRMAPGAVAAALALSLAVMLAAAAAPALVAAGEGVGRLQAASRSVAGSRRSLRGALVVSEVALSLVLLAGAGLLLRSWQRLSAVDPGFDPAGVLTFRVSAPPSRYATAAERAPFYDRVLERLRALPQVQDVGAIGDAPLTGGEGFWQAFFRREGEPLGPEHEGHDAYLRWVAPGYFETMRIPLRRGRSFDERDREGSTPVVIVDRTLAERHFKDVDPLGQRIAVSIGPARVWREIVGVVGEVRQTAMDQPPMEHVYLPHGQSGRWLPHMTVTLRARAEPGLVERLRREVHAVDPETPVYGLEPMAALVQRSVATRRFQTLLLTVFAAVALGLTAVGVYGVLAQSVAQRRREVGIRMAVGARRADVVRLVVGEGMMMAVAGVVLGLLGAAAIARVIAGLLFEVGIRDTVAYVGAASVLAAAALAASYVPARRAASVDPVRVLRQD